MLAPTTNYNRTRYPPTSARTNNARRYRTDTCSTLLASLLARLSYWAPAAQVFRGDVLGTGTCRRYSKI